jgi:NAD(P)-dependent dehydrogenase (short-subunit alcohol dehydrogenase family)
VTVVGDPTRGPAAGAVLPADKAALGQLFDKHGPFDEVVDLTALSRAARPLGSDLLCGCDRALDLVQALEKAQWRPRPRLRLVARAGWMSTEPEAIDPMSAPLWGLGRVIAREHPELNVRLIDLDGAGSMPAFIAHCLHDDGEAEVAFRDGRRFAARIEPMPPSDRRPTPLSRRKTYLITGGTGALGLAVARLFVDQGARHLVLVGRRVENDEAQRQVAKMEETGASVRLVRADIGDDGNVRRLIEDLRAGDPPLGGIVHCAGVVDDGLLSGQSKDRFTRVMAAKARSAWRLHEHTRDLELDFFVLFSSMSAVLGTRGQGSYAAANAFLDGLAHLRRAQGLPAVSINWGGWRDIGMAARMTDAARERLDANGVALIPPQAGLLILESLLTSAAPRSACFRSTGRDTWPPTGARRRPSSSESSPTPPEPARPGRRSGILARLRPFTGCARRPLKTGPSCLPASCANAWPASWA